MAPRTRGYTARTDGAYERPEDRERGHDMDYAAQNVAKAHNKRIRYEMAKAKEARDYGLGVYGNESDRESRGRGRRNSDACRPRDRPK